ncbi:MAG: ribosome small subunit-dependent GTPase A, partial [Clostridiales bacterium]|nr:ribosome small subunit-dependent GTPase A [Clostridiales bacterium]
GVGKSTLLNTFLGEDRSETGEISRKTLRGRHTTRHSELFDCGDFKLFDTPGFTSFDLEGIEEAELGRLFPEFVPYIPDCYFNDCRHLAEPGCAVIKALSEGKISRRRYASYEGMIDFIRSIQKY